MAAVDPMQMKSETMVETTPILSVTPAAVQIIKMLLEQRQIPNHVLRVFVSGGGCSGMQYGMAFEAEPRDFDKVVEAAAAGFSSSARKISARS